MTGIGHDAKNNLIKASPSHWDAIIKERPKAAMYRYEGEKYRRDLIFIFGGQIHLPPLVVLPVPAANQLPAPNLENEHEIIMLSGSEEDDEAFDAENLHLQESDSKGKGKVGTSGMVPIVPGVIIIDDIYSREHEKKPQNCEGKGKEKVMEGTSSPPGSVCSSTASSKPYNY